MVFPMNPVILYVCDIVRFHIAESKKKKEITPVYIYIHCLILLCRPLWVENK